MLIGVYFNGQGGSNAARVLAQALRADGERVHLRDLLAWRSDCVERFDQVVIVPSDADASAIRAAYAVPVLEAADIEVYRNGGKPAEAAPVASRQRAKITR